jgi:peptidoglycan-associated lipoprotein
MTRLSRFGILTLGVLCAQAACHHAPPAVASRPTGPNADSLRLVRLRADSIARADAANRAAMALAAERADSIRRAADAMRLANDNARRSLTAPIHFAFNQWDIEANDRALLDAKTPILMAHRGLQIRIEGSTDERGSDEYNLALGMRRASAARRYLVEHGVDSTRLVITSLGEERPVCQGHDDACWSENRRDEFVITAGDQQIAIRP